MLHGRPSLVVTFIPYLPLCVVWFNSTTAQGQSWQLGPGTGMVGLGLLLPNHAWPTRFVIFMITAPHSGLIYILHAQLSFLLSLLWFGITCILYS